MNKLALINQKGGCSKTTTAINLAAALAEKGHKVLVVDLDPQSNCSQNVGIMAFDYGTPELFRNDKTSVEKMINKTKVENLDIIPSNLALTQIEWQLLKSYKASHVNILGEKLKDINGYDFCIIDCPPSLGLFSLNALVACDRILVPVGLDMFALIGLKYLMSTVDEIRMSRNKKLQLLGIVRTMWDFRPRMADEISGSLQKDYPTKLMKTIIKSNAKIRESVSFKMPVVNYEPKMAAAIQYRELMQEVLEKW